MHVKGRQFSLMPLVLLTSVWRLTQLPSVESHRVHCLPGPQHCVEPSCCDSNHHPSFQHFGEHLFQNTVWNVPSKRDIMTKLSISMLFLVALKHHRHSYLFRNMCWGWRGDKAQLVESVETKCINIALLCQHHGVVFSCCHLGAVVGHQSLHHSRNLEKGMTRKQLFGK